MLTQEDKDFLTANFVTKNDLKMQKKEIVDEVVDYLKTTIIRMLSEHEVRLDRLEKTVGGFHPLS